MVLRLRLAAAHDLRLGRFPRGEIPMHDIEGGVDVVGGSLPAEIWHDFMTSALG